MPSTTRSQTKLEHLGVTSSKPAPGKSKATKRKATDSNVTPAKKQKHQPAKPQAQNETDNAVNDDDDESITINRAPVLELWAGCVAQSLYPSLSWSTSLSVGGAISTLAAISKGRSIGTMNKPDPGQQQERREKRKSEQAELEEVDVMSFNIKLKDGSAMVGDRPKKGNEEALRKKYSDEAYEKVKRTFEEALEKWKDEEDELNGRAFGMYEDFRPSVPTGQNGWGRKGQLSLKNIRSATAIG